MSEKSTYDLEMHEDYCCGGGHCGPLPGYTFVCPLCDKNSICRTGVPLKEGKNFKCLSCKEAFNVVSLVDKNNFVVEQKENLQTA
jgi:hypothetical protein